MSNNTTEAGSKLTGFVGMRVRFQRMSDAKLFSGWMLAMTERRVKSRINEIEGMNPGDEFLVQVYGDSVCSMFNAKFLGASKSSGLFDITTVARILPNNEPMRVLVEGLRCHVNLGWFEAETEIVDISPQGIGIRTNVAVKRGEAVELQFASEMGQISVKGEIRYCRKMEGASNEFRVGIELAEMDRVMSAKWTRLIDRSLEISHAA